MSQRRLIDRRYELDALPLAKGGMGEVWTGRDVKLDREIAVKFVRFPDGQTDQDLVRRFVRESRITARLVHPGVPAVYDAGMHDGRPYLVMQRVHGISVADLVAEAGALPIGWAAAIGAQVASVLTVAHRASLVHRDLKPANLMLEPDGTVKVLDFGLAVGLDRADLSKITLTGQHLGTPAYMAPEQVLAGLSTPATDLYALGATLFEMLTGRRLFGGPSSYSVMHRQVEEIPTRVASLRSGVPAELDQLVADLLHKAPRDRPARVEAVYEVLARIATGLEPLPGVIDPEPNNPVRTYARITAQVHPDTAPAPPPVVPAGAGGPAVAGARTDPARPCDAPGSATSPPASGPVGLVGPSGPVGASVTVGPATTAGPTMPVVPAAREGGSAGEVSRAELRQARDEARGLARASRYSQAAAVLADAVDRAARATSVAGADVLALRLELADILFDGGDFHRAARGYAQLVDELTRRDDRDSERLLHVRLREATCRAMTGDVERALAQLGALRPDQEREFGVDDPRVLELRRQIGLLQLGAGQRVAAGETLAALLADIVRIWGASHPMASAVGQLLPGADPASAGASTTVLPGATGRP
ncbi:serine/threonine protein kinase [Frankia sp. Ag45/Mut15]|uniref:non-specific serine/threonine protein kinase n=1 Tax=Frankia umida TaxID=573489 RepID=A0ABT0K1V4_9ACTN|nr:serine/threonine-protein kinase [Frankia umida]MCK9877732.1 serine/threonine protein kinase [Frankia umida]